MLPILFESNADLFLRYSLGFSAVFLVELLILKIKLSSVPFLTEFGSDADSGLKYLLRISFSSFSSELGYGFEFALELVA